jgi:HPt (histidine-containing phosphotransfer) domain-containing protein
MKVIDWDEALNQVGGDMEFLNEVIQDLLNEAAGAREDIAAAIDAGDFDGVMKAAHRIKGSASYLCCDALRETSKDLQDAGHEAKSMSRIRDLFEEFEVALKDLRMEVSNKK